MWISNGLLGTKIASILNNWIHTNTHRWEWSAGNIHFIKRKQPEMKIIKNKNVQHWPIQSYLFSLFLPLRLYTCRTHIHNNKQTNITNASAKFAWKQFRNLKKTNTIYTSVLRLCALHLIDIHTTINIIYFHLHTHKHTHTHSHIL